MAHLNVKRKTFPIVAVKWDGTNRAEIANLVTPTEVVDVTPENNTIGVRIGHKIMVIHAGFYVLKEGPTITAIHPDSFTSLYDVTP